jgi:hypothetical protein
MDWSDAAIPDGIIHYARLLHFECNDTKNRLTKISARSG